MAARLQAALQHFPSMDRAYGKPLRDPTRSGVRTIRKQMAPKLLPKLPT